MASNESNAAPTDVEDRTVAPIRVYGAKSMAVPLVNDLASSTVQQIFVRSCLPYSPADPDIPDMHAEPVHHSCEDCGDKFLFASSLNFHVNRYSVQIKFTCKECSRPLTFYNRCNFLAHLRLHNAGLSEEELAMLDITSQPIHPNKIPSNFCISDYLKQSTSSEPSPINDRARCFECNVNVSTTLKNHYVGDGYPGGMSLSCKQCKLILPTKCSLLAHIRVHSHKAPFICPDCSLNFTEADLLSDHLKTKCFHQCKIVQYKCDCCSLMFKKMDGLYSHVITNHLKCHQAECQKCVPFFNLCSQDMDDKCTNKDFFHLVECELCSGMISLSNVKIHVKSHARSHSYQHYAYKCQSCTYTCQNLKTFSCHKHPLQNYQGPVTKTAPLKIVTIAPIAKKLQNGFNSILKQTPTSLGAKPHQDALAILDVDKMPLTPSPEPLVEEDPLLLDSPMPPNTDLAPANKTVPLLESSTNFRLIKSGSVRMLDVNAPKILPTKEGNTLTILNPKNSGSNMLQKRHQCTQCTEFIVFDGTIDPVQRHFKEKHPNYEVFSAKKNTPDVKNGNQLLLVTQRFKIFKKTNAPASPANHNGVSKSGTQPVTIRKLTNGFAATSAETSASVNKINNKGLNSGSAPTMMQAGPSKTTRLYSLSKNGRNVTVKKLSVGNEIQFKKSSDDLSKCTNTEKSRDVHASPIRKVKRFRKKKMLDPDFVCNDSDSEGGGKMVQQKLSYSGSKTPPKEEKLKKKPTSNDSSEETPTRGRKRKMKPSSNVQSKTCFSEALGSGLVISPSKHDSGSLFVCAIPQCQFTSKDRDEFKVHVVTHRADKNTYQCMECSLCFVVKPTFTKHLFISHQISDSELYILNNSCCEEGLICREIDYTDYQKIREENIPTVLLEFQCNICYKPCDCALSLNSHFRTHGMAFLRSQFLKNKN